MMHQRAEGQAGGVQQAGQVDAAKATSQTQAMQAAQRADAVQQADKAQKLFLHKNGSGRATFQGVSRSEMASRAETLVTKLVEDMENGSKVMDKLIQAGMSGKSFSNTELITLQAGMYKYTQELELTGKVVEKATSGMKETLKTQV